MKLSIVATLYQSSAYINEFYKRASAAANQFVKDDYEIILVNDGSPDDSLEIAIELTKKDSRIIVIDLSRNFGHHKAMMTGLSHATGSYVFLIDSDLEEEPEWLIDFAQLMQAEKSDVVYGVQNNRRGNIFTKLTGIIFYKTFRFFTGINQPNNIVTARLMTRRYVDALLLHRERELNIGALWIITGFKQCYRTIKKHSFSPTSYSLTRKVNHLVNAVTSFSATPLLLTFYSGIFISASAMAYTFILLFRYFFVSTPPGGYTSIIVSIWFFSGLVILFMGIQGIYISKIFSEVKRRPKTITRHVYQQLRERVRKEMTQEELNDII